MSPSFLRRKDVNSLLRSASFEGKLPYAHENRHASTQAKASLEAAALTITQDLSKINAKEFAL